MTTTQAKMCTYDISGQYISTLASVVFPPNVKILYCGSNCLSNFIGCPSTVEELYCQYNDLTSLIGCPPTLKILCCNGNRLTALAGLPDTLEKLYCHHNRLTSLAGLPSTVKVIGCDDNPLDEESANHPCRKRGQNSKPNEDTKSKPSDKEEQSDEQEIPDWRRMEITSQCKLMLLAIEGVLAVTLYANLLHKEVTASETRDNKLNEMATLYTYIRYWNSLYRSE